MVLRLRGVDAGEDQPQAQPSLRTTYQSREGSAKQVKTRQATWLPEALASLTHRRGAEGREMDLVEDLPPWVLIPT